MRFSVLILFQLFCFGSFAQDHLVCHLSDIDGRYRPHNFDAEQIDLTIAFDVKNSTVFGYEKMTFSPIQPQIDSVYLDAPYINIEKVFFGTNKKEIRFVTNENGVAIYFPTPLIWHQSYVLEIKYTSQPRKGLYFIGSQDEKNISRKQIWTQGQGIDNRHWFPCYDDVNDKAITTTSITFDKEYTVISNGELREKRINKDGTATWNYAMTKPHSPYLVMIAIDKFASLDLTSKSGVLSKQYYYADRPQDAQPTYRYSAEMIDWMEAELQVPFPWTTYANVPVQDFMYGAMENTTATIFGDFYLHDERGSIERPYISTNAHELTHQWFGDCITEWSATHHWLHESFATYYAKQFSASVLGLEQYEMAKLGEVGSAIYADNQDRYPVAHSHGGSNRHYPKGSFVIDMLRYVVGDSVYKHCITQYLKKHAFGMVDSHDFYIAFIENSGINLDWFFDQWIYKSGYPILAIHNWQKENKVYVSIAQNQRVDSLLDIFQFPIDIEFYHTDKSFVTKRFWAKNKVDTFVYEIEKGKDFKQLITDAGLHLIKKSTEPKTYSEYIFQLNNANHFIDRYQALLRLKDTAIEVKRKDLQTLFYTEKSHYIRAEIVVQLAKDDHSNSLKLLQTALLDKNHLVRRAVIESADTLDKSLLKNAILLLKDTSYITIEKTLEKLCLNFPKQKINFLQATQNVQGISQNVRIAWLSLQIEKADGDLWKELLDYTSDAYEFRTRTRAMDAIKDLDLYDVELVKNLLSAAVNPNRRLSGPALLLLKKLSKKPSYNAYLKLAKSNFMGPKWQQELMENL